MKQGPWSVAPPPVTDSHGTAVVLGMGLAGCFTAHYLAGFGMHVHLIDRHPAPGMGTSGNPAAVMLPFVSLEEDGPLRFYNAAYAFSLYEARRAVARGWAIDLVPSGVVHLLHHPRLARKHAQLRDVAPHPFMHALDSRACNHITGLPFDVPALYYPQGCSLSPAALCRELSRHPRITCLPDTPITELVRADGRWHALAGDRVAARGDVVVAANAVDAAAFAPCASLPMRTTVGQLALVKRRAPVSVPQTVVCARDYLIPAVGDDLLLGATWRPDDGRSPTMTDADQQALLRAAAETVPAMNLPDQAPLRGRVARRTTTADHLPLVGPLPDHDACLEVYDTLHLGLKTYPSAPCVPGFYTNLAHGSRGTVTTPLCALHLASLILGRTSPLSDEMAALVHPLRYLARYLKRHPNHRKGGWDVYSHELK